jgi:hypothetical protein
MVKTRQQSKTKQANNLQANHSSKPHRLRTQEETISAISPLSLRLVKTNLNNLKQLQTEKKLSFNFLCNEIFSEFFKIKKESRLNESLNF